MCVVNTQKQSNWRLVTVCSLSIDGHCSLFTPLVSTSICFRSQRSSSKILIRKFASLFTSPITIFLLLVCVYVHKHLLTLFLSFWLVVCVCAQAALSYIIQSRLCLCLWLGKWKKIVKMKVVERGQINKHSDEHTDQLFVSLFFSFIFLCLPVVNRP